MWLRTFFCFRWHLWRDWGEACWARWDPEEPVQLVRISSFPFFAENSPFFLSFRADFLFSFLSVRILSFPLLPSEFSLLFRVFLVYILNSVQLVRIHTLIPGLTFSYVAVKIRKRFFTAYLQNLQYLQCNGRQWIVAGVGGNDQTLSTALLLFLRNVSFEIHSHGLNISKKTQNDEKSNCKSVRHSGFYKLKLLIGPQSVLWVANEAVDRASGQSVQPWGLTLSWLTRRVPENLRTTKESGEKWSRST